jgi:N-acyl homoserine lactone hydrolase
MTNEMTDDVTKDTPTGTIDRMTVLNGGEAHVSDISQWSPGVNVGQSAVFSNNAYLIQHGADLMLWDTGLDDSMIDIPGGRVMAHDVRGIVTRTLASQLEEVGVSPEQVTHIAFSHAHFDHVGNSRYFSRATWHVQRFEYDAMFGPNTTQLGFLPELYETMRNNPVNMLGGHHDVFGDGAVVLHATPGHTPGHQSLLVRLPDRGPVVLSGDVAHFHQNFCCRRVPLFNFDKPRSVDSMNYVDALVAREKAELWINHDKAQSETIPHAPHWIR